MAAPSPFVLLDDARAAGARPARLYLEPVEAVIARRLDEVAAALAAVRGAGARGLHAAGYVGYEAGLLEEAGGAGQVPPRRGEGDHAKHGGGGSLQGGRPAALPLHRPLRGRSSSPFRGGTETSQPNAAPDAPLLWFGLFRDCRLLDSAEVAAWLPDPAGACAGAPEPLVARADHAAAVAHALDYIAAGDVYQVNLTFPCRVAVAGDPRALYARLRGAAAAGWGGIVFTGKRWLLSCSPELFFTLDAGGRIVARPMKGTAPAHGDPATLRDDPKQRAENLMIVDLIRNDLSRVAAPGSVAVPALFEVERYPTVQQMTSTVTATLADRRDAVDLLAAAFPCGSITGAPKRRAMAVIAELEPGPRGAYTGSIGHVAPDGSAAFDVAIRTLEMLNGADHAVLGLGSGIVADSESDAEWRECLAKGAFVSAAAPAFDLIETMRFEPAGGIAELERHLARLTASADALGFAFDRHGARNELQAATFRLRAPSRLRLMLSRRGAVAIEATPAPAPPAEPVTVAVVPLPVPSADVRLRHKTSDRGFYDAARRAAGTFEVAFVDADGFLTEGSFTSLFVERAGGLLTPPLARGLLPGVLRARLIEEGRAVEGELRVEDLAGGFMVGNAVRGLVRARVAASN